MKQRTGKQQKNIDETKRWFFENINKSNNYLTDQEKQRTQFKNINAKGDITNNATEI